MPDQAQERARLIEGLLPKLMRMLYRSADDTVLSELPVAQARILRLLYGGSRTVTALGDELGLTVSAVTQMANRLQDSGLVERVEDPEDRRVKHLALSERAQHMMRSRQERRINRMRSVLEMMEPDRQCAIVEALEDLIQAGGELPKTESLSFVAEMEQAIPPVPPLKK